MSDVLQVEMRPLDSIKPYWNNPRVNDKTKQALVAAFAKIGFNQPILVDREGVIVKGHARYYAAVIAEMKAIPTIVSQNDDEKNKEDRILDNSIADLSIWDPDRLSLEMQELSEINIPYVFEIDETVISAAGRDDTAPHSDDPEVEMVCPECGEVHKFLKSELLAMEETV